MEKSKVLKFAIVVGTTSAALVMLSMIGFAPQAQATPEIAKGKECKTCHSSSKPSKKDLKKSSSKPGKEDSKK